MSAASHEDCVYWGLNRFQCMNRHVRLAEYYADRARVKADEARRHHRATGRLAVAASALALLAAVMLAVS